MRLLPLRVAFALFAFGLSAGFLISRPVFHYDGMALRGRAWECPAMTQDAFMARADAPLPYTVAGLDAAVVYWDRMGWCLEKERAL